MLYPISIEVKLGFDQIREQIRQGCQSSLGEDYAKKMAFSTKQHLIKQWACQVDEFKSIIIRGELPDIIGIYDIRQVLNKSKIEGSFLSEKEFRDIAITLQSADSFLRFLSGKEQEYKELFKLASYVTFSRQILMAIDKVVDEDGELRDKASAELQTIRGSLRGEKGKLRQTVNSIFKTANKNGFVPEGATVTLRQGRMVIPIVSSYKRRIKGFIHDESASGQIVFLEPAETLDSNNKIRELEYAERREIIRILTQLTGEVRVYLPELFQVLKFVGIIDFIWSKAKVAIKLNAEVPIIDNLGKAHLRQLKHPLLLMAYQGTERAVVDQEVILNNDGKIVLISGPNAGGKSVCLKTIGLNQYMLQCGVLPCASPDSLFMLFESLFIDIGDEQSIENDLSTYSSHLQNMRVMMKQSNQDSLILIDEFGTGTDPQFGGAIAQTVLEQLLINKTWGVITTHYANLKNFADANTGIVNAAMEFDMVKLEPKYKLDIGRPGSSFALEIAQKIGLPGDIIKKAKEYVGFDQVSAEKLLAKLEKQKQVLGQKNASLNVQMKEFEKLKAKYLKMTSELESKKTTILNDAKKEASEILSLTNKKIEKTIRHIKETKAHKSETKKVRDSLSMFTEKVKPQKEKKKVHVPEQIEGEIQVGDAVMVKESGVFGEVLELKGGDAKVSMGTMQSTIKLKKLARISKRLARTEFRKGTATLKGININSKMAGFSPTLDIRGKRGHEVIQEVEVFVDNALMLNQVELKIIHGKGNGILRELVRNQLKEYDFISNVCDEHEDRGGTGVTLISL